MDLLFFKCASSFNGREKGRKKKRKGKKKQNVGAVIKREKI
jgi:hypothetical protein